MLRDFSATELTLSVRCSKGFFVRTLAYDLGRALGCGAHLKALRRTLSGPFTLAQALPLARWRSSPGAGGGWPPRLLPAPRPWPNCPRCG